MWLTINWISVLYFALPSYQPNALKQKGFKLLTIALRAVKALGLRSAVVLVAFLLVTQPMQPTVAKGQIQNLSLPADISEEKIGSKVFLVSRMTIRARPEQVWQILTDYDNASRVFPNLKKCKLLQDRGATKVVTHEVCPTGVPGSFKYVLEVKESAPKVLEWHRLSGDFKEVDGIWRLNALDGGRSTYVTYHSYVNGGLFLPQALIRRQFRLDIPGVMAALKSQAESITTTQIARRPEASKSN